MGQIKSYYSRKTTIDHVPIKLSRVGKGTIAVCSSSEVRQSKVDLAIALSTLAQSSDAKPLWLTWNVPVLTCCARAA